MSEKMFCPNCNMWIEEPSVHTTGREWMDFQAGRCPRCKTQMYTEQTTSEDQEAVLVSFGHETAPKTDKLFVCDLCGKNYSQTKLDKHFAKTAKQAAKLSGVVWSGKLVTFNSEGRAWCPHCFKDAKKMQSGARTVHAGERQRYLRPPNLGISYQCKCGRHKTFNCKYVNILTGAEIMCEDCGAVLSVPPTIFDHSKPSQNQEASLRPDYQDQMKFIGERKMELDEKFRQGLITQEEYKGELKRRGL